MSDLALLRHGLLFLASTALVVYFASQYLMLARRKWEADGTISLGDDLMLLFCCVCYTAPASFVLYDLFGTTLVLTGAVAGASFAGAALPTLLVAVICSPVPLLLAKRVAKAKWEQ